ncbi:unnamed protein product [Bathycoccus prasinos]
MFNAKQISNYTFSSWEGSALNFLEGRKKPQHEQLFIQYEHFFDYIDETLREISSKFSIHISPRNEMKLKRGSISRREKKLLKKLTKKKGMSNRDHQLLRNSQIDQKLENMNKPRNLFLNFSQAPMNVVHMRQWQEFILMEKNSTCFFLFESQTMNKIAAEDALALGFDALALRMDYRVIYEEKQEGGRGDTRGQIAAEVLLNNGRRTSEHRRIFLSLTGHRK